MANTTQPLPTLPTTTTQPPPNPEYATGSYQVGDSSPANGGSGGGGLNWFGAVMTMISPKPASVTPIRMDNPLSAQQQAANQRLFVIAVIVILVITGVAVWYVLKS